MLRRLLPEPRPVGFRHYVLCPGTGENGQPLDTGENVQFRNGKIKVCQGQVSFPPRVVEYDHWKLNITKQNILIFLNRKAVIPPSRSL